MSRKDVREVHGDESRMEWGLIVCIAAALALCIGLAIAGAVR